MTNYSNQYLSKMTSFYLKLIILINIIFSIQSISCNKGKNADLVKKSTNLQLQNDSILHNKYSTGEQYLKIGKPTYKDGSNKVAFDVSWDGSWRRDNEYDAAWIFIKHLNLESWTHSRIKNSSLIVVSNKSSDLSLPEIQVSPDSLGLIMYRQSNSFGNNKWRVELEIEECINADSVLVFGLEMVHVPTGAYELGTTKALSKRNEILTDGAGGAPYNPLFKYKDSTIDNYGGIYKISSEEEIEIGPQNGKLFWIDADIPGTNTFSGIPTGFLNLNFPKGFKGFYQMKYELSQQEYCDFLNTLNEEQKQFRDISKASEFNRPTLDYRNRIVKENGLFITNRPHRPCNFISWLDGLSYADWAGLRPMTELEFEKSCRGSEKAVYREYI